jgi:DNA-binding MarR family transcriptional regulator
MGGNEIYRDALEALILMATVSKEARQDTEHRLKGFGADITAAQYRVLRQLQQGRYTIKELSVAMMVEPATLVPMIDSLERQGLIRRELDPRDRRRTPIAVTDLGREQLGHVPFVHHDDPIARYFVRLTEDDRHAFLQHLRDLVVSMHGNEHAVLHIGEAVRKYFDFGELHEGTPDQKE